MISRMRTITILIICLSSMITFSYADESKGFEVFYGLLNNFLDMALTEYDELSSCFLEVVDSYYTFIYSQKIYRDNDAMHEDSINAFLSNVSELEEKVKLLKFDNYHEFTQVLNKMSSHMQNDSQYLYMDYRSFEEVLSSLEAILNNNRNIEIYYPRNKSEQKERYEICKESLYKYKFMLQTSIRNIAALEEENTELEYLSGPRYVSVELGEFDDLYYTHMPESIIKLQANDISKIISSLSSDELLYQADTINKLHEIEGFYDIDDALVKNTTLVVEDNSLKEILFDISDTHYYSSDYSDGVFHQFSTILVHMLDMPEYGSKITIENIKDGTRVKCYRTYNYYVMNLNDYLSIDFLMDSDKTTAIMVDLRSILDNVELESSITHEDVDVYESIHRSIPIEWGASWGTFIFNDKSDVSKEIAMYVDIYGVGFLMRFDASDGKLYKIRVSNSYY